MTVPGLLKSLVAVPGEAIALTVATFVMGAYWYIGSPGPALEADYVRTWETAFHAVLWAVALFGFLPLVTSVALSAASWCSSAQTRGPSSRGRQTRRTQTRGAQIRAQQGSAGAGQFRQRNQHGN